jgi:CubicO group peptidase (beta-lactamase class C family)
MAESGYASTLAVVPKEAEGYARSGEYLQHRDYFDRSLEMGAGGIYSTVGDLLKWNIALDNMKLLNENSITRMFTPDRHGSYGFGWFITKEPRLREFHEGSDPGFAAFEARYPRDGLLVVVLSNLEDAPVRAVEAKLAEIFLSSNPAHAAK